MKELNLEFKTSVNKNKTLRLRQVNESLTPEVVKAAMIKIADANLFEKTTSNSTKHQSQPSTLNELKHQFFQINKRLHQSGIS